MSRPGDWNCRSCSHLNFQRRDSCQRCGDQRPDGRGGGDFGSFGGRSGGPSFGGGFAGPDVRPGDWYCSIGNCGAHNFASRSSCFKCGAYKEESGSGDMGRSRGFSFGSGLGGGGPGGSGRSGWKSGDWICTRSGCNEHNFASRTECFRCREPRDSGSNSAY
ncbi:transcription initiation factor TFIID subunit 15b-like [Chenopodium quinoa]|uniref:RanBP2-type domain-containing protein n=1 Tax=Chenopodium quinoa TaxID=63459 RepID=A0A803MJS8_CHEQI|nr:transcription initiation factor TFIID subunit 15b-like [Chenopodium quinoa]XP_021758166.1 transcription initiation factor TFIID subunit 15b-like [Chenopodium quinoa]XP_021758167.1 transcription initiation factor TFIID subunit 15b-like [Chenopodium quinoa]